VTGQRPWGGGGASVIVEVPASWLIIGIMTPAVTVVSSRAIVEFVLKEGVVVVLVVGTTWGAQGFGGGESRQGFPPGEWLRGGRGGRGEGDRAGGGEVGRGRPGGRGVVGRRGGGGGDCRG